MSMIEAQAYLTFYPVSRGRAVVFTTAGGTSGPGLYLADARTAR